MIRTSSLALLAACLILGCQSTPPPPSAGLGDPYPPPLNDPQITVLEPELRQWLRFHPARIEQGPGPMAVEVPVRNLADRDYLIDYRILFYDAEDLELEPRMGWRFLAIRANETERLKAKALSPEAAGYRLEIKWAR